MFMTIIQVQSRNIEVQLIGECVLFIYRITRDVLTKDKEIYVSRLFISSVK